MINSGELNSMLYDLKAFEAAIRKARQTFPQEYFDNFWRAQSDDLKLP
jgi:hypothetical protein